LILEPCLAPQPPPLYVNGPSRSASEMAAEAQPSGPEAKVGMEPTSPISRIWQAALEKYYTELAKGGIKASVIDKDLWKTQSPEELIAQIEAVGKTQATQSSTWSQALARLRPILLGLNDFAALASEFMGMNEKIAAVLWGSIRLIIKFAQPVLPDIIEMLESLEHALPRMRQYGKELPRAEILEKAFSDTYGEIIVFYAHAIVFFRNNPDVGKNRIIWSQFSNKATDMIRLSKEEVRNSETLAALQEMQGLRISDGVKLPCFMIPYELNPRFFGRDAELAVLREILDPTPERKTLRAAGIYGLGGVGKSQLALHYANTSMDKYGHFPAEKIFAKSKKPVDYDDTVFTTWNISLQKLSEEATRLQNLLVFFNPDLIPEWLITNTKAEIDDPDLDFGEAVMELTRTSMVSRLSSSKALSMHRLVQLVVFARLSKAERVKLFDLTIHILYHDFPNTWQNRGAHQGHGWQSWETCSDILSHVDWLMTLSDKHKIKSSNPESWAELVFRAATYLWEKEQSTLAKSFVEFGLSIDEDVSGPIATQAHRLLGHVFLDLAQPRAALSTYKKTLELTEKLDGHDSPPVADVCDSIACAYTEVGEVEHAFEYLEKATTIHNSHDPSRMMRTLAIRSMTCLRAGQPENALTAIRECWRLQGMTQDEIEASHYPKHSGDIMLLARIFWLQGNKGEAQELVSRTVAMRRGTFGENGGPRVADSLFTLARMLQDGGELVLAAKLLRQIVEMSGDALGMKPHKARALWFSAGVEAKIGAEEDRVAELRENARVVRQTVGGREWPDDDTDEAFMNLVSWMLW
ncbi:hypothetical protein FALBO_14020, partial [Fusarium albosuccineum]